MGLCSVHQIAAFAGILVAQECALSSRLEVAIATIRAIMGNLSVPDCNFHGDKSVNEEREVSGDMFLNSYLQHHCRLDPEVNCWAQLGPPKY